MAKPKPRDDGSIEYRKFGEPVAYVLNNLDEADAALLENSPLDPEVLFQMHDKAHEQGFVCTTKFDAYSKCWQATLICNAKGFPNTGFAVTGRSRQGVSDAMFVAYFKLYHVAKGELFGYGGATKPKTYRG